MDPAIDIRRRMTEQLTQATRQYLNDQRSRAGGVGRSADGTAEVTLDGLGDVSDVRIHARGVSAQTASRLAVALRQAWLDASRQVATATARNMPLADRPDLAQLVEQHVSERYGSPGEPSRSRPASDEDDDFTNHTLLR